jgi:hypothetical protein
MCKKLMFLISFVAQLGLVNVASAIDWIGTGSFCEPSKWDGGVVPGPDDEAWIDCDQGGGDIVIDCDVEVDELRGPAIEADCNQTMDIVSGTVLADNWRAAMEGDGVGIVNFSGGSVTSDGEMRVNDDAKFRAYFNMSGTSILVCNYRVRSGDSGGNDNQTHWSFTDDAIVSVDHYLRIGDDGGGSFTLSGNASLNIGYNLYFVCRESSVTVDVSGGEAWVANEFRLGNPGQAAGKAASTCNMTMTGGTINARRVRMGWEPYPDFSSDVDMSGGLIVCREDLQIGENTTVSLTGGEIRIDSSDSLEIDSGGNLDICGGTLKIKGNVAADVAALVCDGSGRLTGCGTAPGVVIEYDGTYTVVTGTTEGIDPDKAFCPDPANGAVEVQSVVTEVVLCWEPGASVGTRGRHLVYFGTDPAAVLAAGPGDPENVCVNRADVLCCNVGNLPLWTQHCWRVDEFNEDGSTTTGDLWCFTTGCAAIPGDTNMDCLVNFEDYACVAGTFGDEQFWPEE